MKQSLRDYFWPLALAVALAVVVSALYLSRVAFLDLLELKAYDLRLRARGALNGTGRVAIVAIDEKSLEEIGRWPWSRDVMARLAARIDACDPLGVGYDIGFFDPEASPAQDELVHLARNAADLGLLPNPKLPSYIKKRLQEVNPDLKLAKALQACEHPHILGYYFNFDPEQEQGINTLDTAEFYPLVKAVGRKKTVDPLPVYTAKKARTNIPTLAEAAYSQAYFNIIPDIDGTIRHYPLIITCRERSYIPLAGALAALTDPQSMPSVEAGDQGPVRVGLGKTRVPTDRHGRMMLHYRGPEGSIPHIPAWRILQGEADSEFLRNRFVLVGVTAPAVFDLRVTPFGVAYPGIEVQATALDNMLAGDFLLRPTWAPLFDLAAVWALCLICGLFLWRIKALWSVSALIFVAAGFVFLNQYLFEHSLFWLNLIYPVLGLLASYLALNIYRFMFADRQKRAIRQAFSKYLDPHVVDDVVADPDKLRLGGVKLNLTVLFSDIRGFTSISEAMSPDELVRLLNDYLTEMTGIVMHNRGLLDKYMGDAVMAVFGAPKHYPEHALMACRTALNMMSRLKELNAQWADMGRPPLNIGVGVNTGHMVAGNMGSQDRFDYTVMGDHVNLGSRLEGLNKVYGTNIIISEFTLAAVGEEYHVRSLDMVRVKGKDSAVKIFELLGPAGEPCPLEYLEQYEKGMTAYRKGDFSRAQEIFSDIQRTTPSDTVVALYLERLKHLQTDPPTSWDGVYTFTTK